MSTQLIDDAAEEAGMLYFSPDANDGEVRLFAVLRESPRAVIRVELPEDFMTEEVRECIDALVAVASQRHRLKLAK